MTVESIDDRAVLEGTGRHPDEWFAFLDAQRATEWSHERRVEWLLSEAPHIDVDWAEQIAARFERARGLD